MSLFEISYGGGWVPPSFRCHYLKSRVAAIAATVLWMSLFEISYGGDCSRRPLDVII
jgi:hypothetical protein